MSKLMGFFDKQSIVGSSPQHTLPRAAQHACPSLLAVCARSLPAALPVSVSWPGDVFAAWLGVEYGLVSFTPTQFQVDGELVCGVLLSWSTSPWTSLAC